jgi:hypothetical protein
MPGGPGERYLRPIAPRVILLRMMRRSLLVLAFLIPIACVATAIALPSSDPCREQMIMGCPFLANDRFGLRLVIGGGGLLAGALVLLIRAVEKKRRAALGE